MNNLKNSDIIGIEKEYEKNFAKIEWYEYSPNQGVFLYEKYIQPLEQRISQIKLYDTKKAEEFSNKLKTIRNNKSKKIMDIVTMIVKLENEIEDYLSKEGSKLKLNEQLKIINEKIDELNRESPLVSLDECLEELSNIKKKGKEIKYANLEEQDSLYKKIYKLQADLISRAVREKADIGLEDLIQKDDENGLKIAISQKINELSQSQDVEEKSRAQKMRYIMLIDQDCVHSMQLWQLMNGTEYEIVRINQNLSETNTLPEVYNRRNIKTMIMSLITNFLGLFKREQTTKSQLSDLAKIDIEYLAEQIEKNPYILEDNEKLRLEREGRKNVDEIFIPDARTLIYDFFEGFYDTPIRVKFNKHNGDIIKVYEYNYTDNNGLEKKLIVSGEYFDENSDEPRWGENYSFFGEGVKKECRYFPGVHCAIKYVQFVDKILGTDLTKRMLCELEECEIGDTLLYENVIKYKGKEWKVLYKILKSYYEMKEECEKNKFNFRGSEARRRNNFYMKSNFKKRIEVPETEDGKIIGGLLEKNKNGSKKKKKKKKKKDKKKDPEYNNNRPEEKEI